MSNSLRNFNLWCPLLSNVDGRWSIIPTFKWTLFFLISTLKPREFLFYFDVYLLYFPLKQFCTQIHEDRKHTPDERKGPCCCGQCFYIGKEEKWRLHFLLFFLFSAIFVWFPVGCWLFTHFSKRAKKENNFFSLFLSLSFFKCFSFCGQNINNPPEETNDETLKTPIKEALKNHENVQKFCFILFFSLFSFYSSPLFSGRIKVQNFNFAVILESYNLYQS